MSSSDQPIDWDAFKAYCTTNPDANICGVYCNARPDDALCQFVESYYKYRVSLPANATFLALFSISFILFAATYAFTRRGLAFTIALLLGVACEVIGYVGRVLSWQNQWSENGFLIQIVCLTIGPAFMAAGIYFCLRRIVYAFGPENSRIKPEWYTRIVCSPCYPTLTFVYHMLTRRLVHPLRRNLPRPPSLGRRNGQRSIPQRRPDRDGR
jgi:hypothetical protein